MKRLIQFTIMSIILIVILTGCKNGDDSEKMEYRISRDGKIAITLFIDDIDDADRYIEDTFGELDKYTTIHTKQQNGVYKIVVKMNKADSRTYAGRMKDFSFMESLLKDLPEAVEDEWWYVTDATGDEIDDDDDVEALLPVNIIPKYNVVWISSLPEGDTYVQLPGKIYAAISENDRSIDILGSKRVKIDHAEDAYIIYKRPVPAFVFPIIAIVILALAVLIMKKHPVQHTAPKETVMAIQKIIQEFDQDIGSDRIQLTAPDRAKAYEVSQYGEAAIPYLVKQLPYSTDAHAALGIIGGEKAFQLLIRELRSGNEKRMNTAASELGAIGDTRAISHIRSSPIGNSSFAGRVIIQIQEVNESSMATESIESADPLQQLKGKWAEYEGLRIQLGSSAGYRYKKQQNDFIAYLCAYKDQMHRLKFASTADALQAWRMLGIMLYYLHHPGVTGFYEECEDAAYCFEQYLSIRPDEADVTSILRSIKKAQ